MENELTTLLARVREMFHKYGIRSVTMDDVSRELGISKKTLYQYVSDKEDLVRKTLLHDWEDQHACFEEIRNRNLNAIEELVEIQKQIQSIIAKHNTAIHYDLRKYYPTLLREMVDKKRSQVYNNMLQNLQKGKTEGVYRADLNENIIAKLSILRMEMETLTDFFEFENYSSSDVFNELFMYHVHAICSDKGLAMFKQKRQELINTSLKNS